MAEVPWLAAAISVRGGSRSLPTCAPAGPCGPCGVLRGGRPDLAGNFASSRARRLTLEGWSRARSARRY